MKEYTKVLRIDELLNIPVRNLSLGQRMKCEIAIAFLHNPKIVYLDEPTSSILFQMGFRQYDGTPVL